MPVEDMVNAYETVDGFAAPRSRQSWENKSRKIESISFVGLEARFVQSEQSKVSAKQEQYRRCGNAHGPKSASRTVKKISCCDLLCTDRAGNDFYVTIIVSCSPPVNCEIISNLVIYISIFDFW